MGQFLLHVQSQFLSYYIKHSCILCLPRKKWNFLDQRTVAKIRLWNSNKISETCELLQQRKPISTKQHSQRHERWSYFRNDMYCPVLVHYCLATQFGTGVFPVVAASKEQDSTTDVPQQHDHFINAVSQHLPPPRTAPSQHFWHKQSPQKESIWKTIVGKNN